jgi:hypothetical protein
MARIALAATTAAAAAAITAFGAEAALAPTTPVYGIAGPRPVGLVRVDPQTLRPLPGRRVPLAAHTFGWSFSPDSSKLAIGTDGSAEVRIVDLRRWRVLGDVKIGVARRRSVLATAWAGSSRVLAVVVSPGCCGLGDTTVAAIDAQRQRLLWQRRLGGSLQDGQRFRRSLVLVLGPRGRMLGPSRLALVGPDGRVRFAPLAEIRSGVHGSSTRNGRGFITDIWNPGSAVDAAGARTFVVQAGAPIAEVDLRTLRVRYHTLSQPISLLGRLHDWLEPKAEAKAGEGPTRRALWLGQGRLAVTGTDEHASADASGNERQWETAAGLKLIDTHRWTIRTIDSDATWAVRVGGTLVTSSLLWDSRPGRFTGSGLTGYTLDGRRTFHRYGDDPISGTQPLGTRLLVGGAAGSRIFRLGALLDARTGRELGRVHFDVELLAEDQSFWY